MRTATTLLQGTQTSRPWRAHAVGYAPGLLAIASPTQRPSQLHRHASSLARPVRAGLGVDGGGGGEEEEERRERRQGRTRGAAGKRACVRACMHACASEKAPSPSVHRLTTADLPARTHSCTSKRSGTQFTGEVAVARIACGMSSLAGLRMPSTRPPPRTSHVSGTPHLPTSPVRKLVTTRRSMQFGQCAACGDGPLVFPSCARHNEHARALACQVDLEEGGRKGQGTER
jgi:hypothetical protein